MMCNVRELLKSGKWRQFYAIMENDDRKLTHKKANYKAKFTV